MHRNIFFVRQKEAKMQVVCDYEPIRSFTAARGGITTLL